ncbi:MAG: imidazole glycerol phosphate synthase cyclase subunit [Cyanobacteria bacterium TGS_CYA1]|nr:imidazole glycerol phosphate synthase cyclase subunit [Cyanobacteria bacterium TGS_CYA1]
MARLIARLDIKGPNLIKGVHLEGLRVIGDPQLFAQKYYNDGADELIYMDSVASLYGRNNLVEIVKHTAQNIFIPLTVGGGVRSVEDATQLLRSGADKVAVNTACVANPSLINDLANRFGSQCVVLSVEAKKTSHGKWEAYTDNGREKTGKDVLNWVLEAVERGAGEVLLTSVDKEGTKKGFDVELVKTITGKISVPVIASGGMGQISHIFEVLQNGGADAVALANVLHYDTQPLKLIRKELSAKYPLMRPVS